MLDSFFNSCSRDCQCPYCEGTRAVAPHSTATLCLCSEQWYCPASLASSPSWGLLVAQAPCAVIPAPGAGQGRRYSSPASLPWKHTPQKTDKKGVLETSTCQCAVCNGCMLFCAVVRVRAGGDGKTQEDRLWLWICYSSNDCLCNALSVGLHKSPYCRTMCVIVIYITRQLKLLLWVTLRLLPLSSMWTRNWLEAAWWVFVTPAHSSLRTILIYE